MRERNADPAAILEAVETLRAEVARLSERLAALEAPSGADTPAAAPAPPRPVEEQISEELVLVISAAIAAFLGVKPHIRQIRLVGGRSWAQQGRVTVQASHALAVRHD